jgi:hypothetical protein
MTKKNLLNLVSACLLALPTLSLAEEPVEIGATENAKSSQPDQTSAVRAHRKLALTLEIPWNGLVGIGPMLHFYPIPNLAIDGGIGLGGTGWKYGIRGRYLFTRGLVAPFVGAGFMSGSGTGDATVTLTTNNNTIKFKLASTSFVQVIGGIDIMTKGGFTFLGGLGYAICLNRDNVTVTQGIPTDVQKQAFDIAYRGGLVLSINLGYAFKIK